MGRFEITLNDLENHLSSKKDSSYVKTFLNDFFEIGFSKNSHEVLDQNNLKIIGINFTYEDLVNKIIKRYIKVLNFLERRESMMMHYSTSQKTITINLKVID